MKVEVWILVYQHDIELCFSSKYRSYIPKEIEEEDWVTSDLAMVSITANKLAMTYSVFSSIKERLKCIDPPEKIIRKRIPPENIIKEAKKLQLKLAL